MLATILFRFLGKWNVSSRFTDLVAPLGVAVFGGNASFEKAQRELKSSLSYAVKFKTNQNREYSHHGSVSTLSSHKNVEIIADRLYNVEQIAMSAMGPNSIIDDRQEVSNSQWIKDVIVILRIIG